MVHTRVSSIRRALVVTTAVALPIVAVVGCGSDGTKADTTVAASTSPSTSAAPDPTTTVVATTGAAPATLPTQLGAPVEFTRRTATVDGLTTPPAVVTWTPRADWCVWLGSGTYEAAGDISGELAASGAFSGGNPVEIAPCTSYGTATWIFAGTVTDCGSGTFVVLETLDIAGGAGRWQIGTDSGTGDLVGLSGVGTLTISDTVSVGYEGNIDCG